jgi:hypothetical protein
MQGHPIDDYREHERTPSSDTLILLRAGGSDYPMNLLARSREST